MEQPRSSSSLGYQAGSSASSASESPRCPVCLKTFNDPCFVCSMHHTLCRSCYQRVLNSSTPRCPECREVLDGRPVDNAHLRDVIESQRRQQRLQRELRCEAGGGTGRVCERPVLTKCRHCDRYLCDLHFSEDRMQLEAECQSLLEVAQRTVEQASHRQATAKLWVKYFETCRQLLDEERKCLDALVCVAQEVAEGNSPVAVQEAVRELQQAMAGGTSGGLAYTADAFQQLLTATNEAQKLKSTVGQFSCPPPSHHVISKFEGSLTDLANDMQRPYLEAVHGTAAILQPVGVLMSSDSAAGNTVWNKQFSLLQRFTQRH